MFHVGQCADFIPVEFRSYAKTFFHLARMNADGRISGRKELNVRTTPVTFRPPGCKWAGEGAVGVREASAKGGSLVQRVLDARHRRMTAVDRGTARSGSRPRR